MEREVAVVQVLKSGFYLAPARPVPYMLNQLYKGPVLILQGVLDPLNNAAKRADLLEAAITNSEKICIEAGHCPHDEVPEQVNKAVLDFSVSVTRAPKAMVV
jgi:pimeloyl-ACP methyl ester carboxylesterase